MRPSEALDQVGSFYAPGCAKYYSQLKPDPWFEAHEDLERVMLQRRPDLTEAAAERFVLRCRELVERFKREGSPSRGTSNADALYAMDPERITAHRSRKTKRCVHCNGADSLMIQNRGEVDVVVVCRTCLPKERATNSKFRSEGVTQ